jgi:hypothetical protein
MPKRIFLTLCACLLFSLGGRAANRVTVDLTIHPTTHSFTCRYTLEAPAAVPVATLALNLNRQLRLTRVRGAHLRAFAAHRFFDSFQQDTLQRLTVDFTCLQARPTLTVEYEGTLPPRFYAADSLLEFTPYASWLPSLPDREYEPVAYRLTVHVPAGYQVVSTHAPQRARAGQFEFVGTAPNIEIIALVARAFTRLESAGPGVRVLLCKATRSLTHPDTLLLSEARRVIAFQNRIIGGQDSIRAFTLLLPGTNRNAGGLMDNAAVITYADFDVRKPADRLILAHEISHKWWGYGTWNSYDN